MGAKKFLLALVLSFIVMFVLSFVWHDALMGDYYKTNDPSIKDEVHIPFVALGYYILALLMVYIYPKGFKGGSPVGEGLRFGLFIGLLWLLPRSVVLYGVLEGSSGVLVIVDSVWHLVEQGIGGIIIGLVHGTGESSSGAE